MFVAGSLLCVSTQVYWRCKGPNYLHGILLSWVFIHGECPQKVPQRTMYHYTNLTLKRRLASCPSSGTDVSQPLPSQTNEFHNKANVICENQFISSLSFKTDKWHLFLYNEIISVKNGSYLKCKIQLHLSIFIYSPHVIPLKICVRLSVPEDIVKASQEVGTLQGMQFPLKNPPLSSPLLLDL